MLQEIEEIKTNHVLCYVATNQEKYRTEYLINKLHFGKIFQDVFSSANIGFMKSNPAFFKIVLEKIKLQPQEVLYWDDHLPYLESAKSVGIQTEFYIHFANFQKKMKKYL